MKRKRKKCLNNFLALFCVFLWRKKALDLQKGRGLGKQIILSVIISYPNISIFFNNWERRKREKKHLKRFIFDLNKKNKSSFINHSADSFFFWGKGKIFFCMSWVAKVAQKSITECLKIRARNFYGKEGSISPTFYVQLLRQQSCSSKVQT